MLQIKKINTRLFIIKLPTTPNITPDTKELLDSFKSLFLNNIFDDDNN